jgi:phosphoribosylanthranilate isomerase
MRPLVKICGLTRPEDARLAVRLGATHVGCVMAPTSLRCASLEQARSVFQAAGDGVRRVLVYRRQAVREIVEMARDVGTTDVQLHEMSEENALWLEREGLRVCRTHRVDPKSERLPVLVPEPTPDRPALLDVGDGGSGRSFRWEILGDEAPRGVFIAGGIRPDNVAALLSHHPYGIDLSSGIESSPGVKDPKSMTAFFEAVRSAS